MGRRVESTSRRPGPNGRSVQLEVRPITAEDLEEASAVVGGSRGTGCWCQRFTGFDGPDKRSAFEREVQRSDAPLGLLAYRGGRCVGWSRVVLRSSLPGITANRALIKVFDQDEISPAAAWWISCVAVTRSDRGQGVGVALLRAAVNFARTHGGEVLDGHPVDVSRLRARPSPAAIFTGTATMFEAAGFEEIARTYISRPVMRALL